ncbi:MAG: hypothetical protein KGL39_33105 [Patescibacteria group bacterium]|nr:hypothetical protein [Patescibacteria group bacterium]
MIKTVVCIFACAVLSIGMILMGGCAKSTVTTPPTPQAQATQYITYLNAAVTAGEAVVSLYPNMSASVRTEVTTGLADFSKGLTCATAAIASGATGASLGLQVTGCFTSINIASFSTQAQSYLTAINAGVQSLLTLFTPTSAPAIASSDLATVAALQSRSAALGTSK